VPASATPVVVAQASPSAMQAEAKDAVKTALKSVNLTRHQKIQIAPMLENYKNQTANADDATKKTQQKALIKQIYGILSPDQQAQFKASLKQSMMGSH